MRGELRPSGLVLVILVAVAVPLILPIPAAPVTITIPYSSSLVADSDLDGNPATGAWSGAGPFAIPLENGAASPYGSATMYAKHDGTYLYVRVDGSIDVPWTSASGNHFWFGMFFGPASATGHHQTGQDGTFFGDSSYTSGPPLLPVDTDGTRPPVKDGSQDALGEMRWSGTGAPYAFTAEWKRKLNTADAKDVVLVADGTTSYYFYATTDSNGGGSGGGTIGHKGMTNDNVVRFARVPPSDSAAPSVAIASPKDGDTVNGSILVTATATDNVGVASVAFLIDGAPLGTDNVAPYEQSWDTTTATNGLHRIRADARDAAGNVGASGVNVTVDNLDRVAPTAVAGPDVTVPPGTVVTFDASASSDNVGIVDYAWSFTDGGAQVLHGVIATYAFANIGDFLVTLTVSDAAGNLATDQLWVNVTADRAPPIADAGVDQVVLQGTLVTFDGRASTDDVAIENFTWTFVDSAPLTLWGATVENRFLNVRDVKVTLTVRDFVGNTASDAMWVNVTADPDPPVADAGPDTSINLGMAVVLDGSGSTDNVFIANFSWRVTPTGDILYGARVAYVPSGGGVWRFTLTVADASGLTATDDTNVTVIAPDTTAPVAPSGLVLVASGPGAISLSWAANAESDLAGYLIFRADVPGGPYILLNARPVTATTYVDSGLVPGQAYAYLIKAVDTSGNASGASASVEASAGLLPEPPFDWRSVRWLAVPGLVALTFFVLAFLARGEVVRKRSARPKEASK